MQALIRATPNSLNNCFPAVFKSNLPFAKPCTTMADDCIPTFHPVPPISGMKSAVAGFLAMFDSKFPKITEFANPPTIPMSSHGSRAAV